MSIRLKIVLFSTFIEIITITTIIVFSLIYYHNTHLIQYETKVIDVSRLISVSIRESLSVEHFLSTHEIIDSIFFEIPEVDNIILQDYDGEIIEQKQRGRNLISNKHIVIDSTICIGNNIIGLLRINYSTENLFNEVLQHAIFLLSLGIFGSSLSSFLLFKIVSKITETIKEVSISVETLLAGKNPDTIISNNEDELGHLIDNYNKLIKTLRYRC
jgi:methyl-accepting chemotaxis protein